MKKQSKKPARKKNLSKNRNSGYIAAAIAIAVAIIAVITFLVVTVVKYTITDSGDDILSSNIARKETVDPSTLKYINEVKYTGPIKYMDLYNYPFGKTSYYVMNKDLPVKTDLAAKKAQAYIKDVMTHNYRDLVSNPGQVAEKINAYTDPYGIFFSNIPGYEFMDDEVNPIEIITDRYVQDGLSTEAAFVTDPSLVYEDGYIYCRGVIELKEYSKDRPEKTRCIPAEITMKMTEGDFFITGMVTIPDYPEFEADNAS